MTSNTLNQLKFVIKSHRKSSETLSVESLKIDKKLYAHVKRAKYLSDPIMTLRYALSEANIPGIALEFGVYSGRTLQIISEVYPNETYGFDSFDGLPEFWRDGFPKGTFKLESIPDVANSRIYKGLFQDTLKSFMNQNKSNIAFIHLDADLYSSTKFFLTQLNESIMPGTIILFDEFMNYPSFTEHEYRAYLEWCNEFGRECIPIAYTDWHEQMAFKVVF